MKNILILMFILLLSINSNSQTWIIGDTMGYTKIDVSSSMFLPDSKVVFDIDCDGLEDININSNGPIDENWPWSRLSFYMRDNVQCLMLDPGYITAFDTGDTINLSNENIFDKNLDFIFGIGKLGNYGQSNIQEKYLVFRKKTLTDTNYIFILFSNKGINFTIHHIISSCSVNPIEILTKLKDVQKNDEVLILSNPVENTLYLSKVVNELLIFSINGELIFRDSNSSNQIDISQLEKGLYFLIFNQRGKRQMLKFVKN